MCKIKTKYVNKTEQYEIVVVLIYICIRKLVVQTDRIIQKYMLFFFFFDEVVVLCVQSASRHFCGDNIFLIIIFISCYHSKRSQSDNEHSDMQTIVVAFSNKSNYDLTNHVSYLSIT